MSSVVIYAFGLFFGLALLVTGAELFVKGASGIARIFKIPEFAIGATLVALGTSLPELITSAYAAVQGHPDISVGNVIGSNIFNIAIVLGFTALLGPIRLNRNLFQKDSPMFIASLLILFGVAQDQQLTRGDGLLFLTVFAGYFWWLLKEREEPEIGLLEYAPSSQVKCWLYIIFGGLFLWLGSKLAVINAVNIARELHVSEWFISATVISAGTGLPEFITSIIAMLRRRRAIAVGNVIGSNIINIVLVLGVSSTLATISVSRQSLYFDFIYLTLLSLLLIFMVSDKEITKESGLLLIVSYLVYIKGMYLTYH